MLLQSELEKNNDNFIRKYCQPENSRYSRRPALTNAEYINLRWEELKREYRDVDQDYIKRYLCKKPYESYYLKTYWWYIIRHKKLLMDGFKCTDKNCDGSCTTLQVHHPNYDHKGEEIKYMHCIETLCKTCHRNEHNLGEEEPKKKRRPRIKKNTFVVLTKTEDVANADEFNEKIKTMFSEETTITSDPQKYVVTMTTKTMTNSEVRAALHLDIDNFFSVLKSLELGQ